MNQKNFLMNAQDTSSSHNHMIQLNIVYNFWLAHNPTCPSQNTAKLQYAEIMLLSIRDNASSMVKVVLDIVTTCFKP